MKPRRLSFQLAPLLDLMLVVFFLQFIDIRQKEQTVREEHRHQKNKTTEEMSALETARDRAEAELVEAQEKLADAQDQLRRAGEQSARFEQSLGQVTERQQRLGEMVTNLWKIPPEEVEKLLNDSESGTSIQSPKNRQQLKERFRQLAHATPGEMIHQLLSLEEIRKRCDVWELTIDRKGVAHLETESRTYDLRIPLNPREAVEKQQLEDELFALYKSLPQPKNLVIVLLTYDRSTRLIVAEGVADCLPHLVGRMTTDAAGLARFEYADLGFRVDSR